MAILEGCETGEVSSALHIFPTNRQVNEHNLQQLFKSCPDRMRRIISMTVKRGD